MGWHMTLQPNGRYARWSTVVDNFTDMNLTYAEGLKVCRECRAGVREAEEMMLRASDRPEQWKEDIETLELLHGRRKAKAVLKLDASLPTITQTPGMTDAQRVADIGAMAAWEAARKAGVVESVALEIAEATRKALLESEALDSVGPSA